MAGSMQGFQNAFTSHVKSVEKTNLTKSPENRTKARAASKVLGQAGIVLFDFLKSKLGCLCPLPVENLNCELSHFAVQAGTVTGAAEKGWCGSLRVAVSGTKTVFAISAANMHSIQGVADPCDYWKTMLAPESIKNQEKFMQCVMAGTVGPFDFIWLPAGWIFAENIMQDRDLVGFVIRGVSSRNPLAHDQLQLVRKLLNSANKTDADLGLTCAFLTRQQQHQAETERLAAQLALQMENRSKADSPSGEKPSCDGEVPAASPEAGQSSESFAVPMAGEAANDGEKKESEIESKERQDGQ